VLVLLIPIVMMGIVYGQTHHVIEKEINRANTSLLTQMQEQIDAQIEHVKRMRDAISLNTRVQKFLFAPPQLTIDHRIEMVQTFADFKTYSSTNQYVDGFYIYYRTGDFILTDRSYYEPEVYYDTYLKQSGVPYDEWLSFLGGFHRGALVNGEAFGMGTGAGEIFLSQSLPIGNPASKLATLVIHMNKERIGTSLRNIQTFNGGDAYILDKEGRLMATLDPEQTASQVAFPEGKARGIVRGIVDGKASIVSYSRSSLTDWTYVYSLPDNVYSEKAEFVRDISLITVAISIVLGATTAIVAARQQYNPIQRLMAMATSKSRAAPDRSANEISYIESTLEQAFDLNEEMNKVIAHQNTYLRSNLIVRLLKGRLEENFPLEEALAEYQVDVQAGGCAVLLFYIEDFSGLFREGEQDPEKNLRFVHLIMSNIIEELTRKQYRGWMAEVDEMMACLINFEPGTDVADAKASIASILEDARSILGDRFHIAFTVSISTIHPSVREVHIAFREAVEAMEFRLLMGASATIEYERIQQQTSGYVYPLEMEQRLINYVKAGDYENAKAIMDEAIQSNLSGGSISVGMVRCFMFDMISTMMKASMEAVSPHSGLYEVNHRAVQSILQEQTVGEMRLRMEAFLHVVCEHVDSRKKSRNVKLKDELIAYIETNYRDPNVSVAVISEQFDLHPSYLSRFFKDQTGDALSDYLNRYRLSKAKILLLADDAVVKNVCEEVGIYSVSTFIRLFKKYEGLTPGAYREMQRD
jgi:AraC-like DNA-binding protein